MLQIKDISKEYRTGTLVQKALDHVSLNLRDNEFVAILGPSGSGKTTLLNIIGGLDRYDSGDLIINGVSTKKYKDRDWDSYRNHTIGFVFQSYNLIPHQSVLANVELALTIGGISGAERRKRAEEALRKVGLGDQMHKKPAQMSGGQMQRVAIARALVNDPDILLADEPTGALDSETSVQVMDLLKEVASDRLVVMVTHNPELAEQYATRIVRLRDGSIRSDTDPFIIEETDEQPVHKNLGKASMSYMTALSLSLNNLKSKLTRTLLVSFAGSIGIIGIAAILSLSTGVNQYIKSIEEDTLTEYPLTISSAAFDMNAMVDLRMNSVKDADGVTELQTVTTMFSTMTSNDLGSLKKYLDSSESHIYDYAKAVEYTYSVTPQIYYVNDDDSYRQVNPDQTMKNLGYDSSMYSSFIGTGSTDIFQVLPEEDDLYKGQYDVLAGRWPENSSEAVLVLTMNGKIYDLTLYSMGKKDPAELDEMMRQFKAGEDVVTPAINTTVYDYEEFIGVSYKVINAYDCYVYDSEYKVWTDKSSDREFMKKLFADGRDLTIVGVVRPSEDTEAAMLTAGINYEPELVLELMQEASESEIVKKQMSDPSTDLITGKPFGDTDRSDVSLDNMFTVDTAAMENAFSFDTSAMDLSSLNFDLSGMDLSSLMNTADLSSAMPEIDVAALMSTIRINVTAEDMEALFKALLEGYSDYAKSDVTTDYTKLPDSIAEYLKTPEAQELLAADVQQIIEEAGIQSITTEALQNAVVTIMSGYQQYITDNNLTDPDQTAQYIADYLQTETGQQMLQQAADKLIADLSEIVISEEQIGKLTEDLVSGYDAYAAEHDMPQIEKILDSFGNYLEQSSTQALITSAAMKAVDTSELQRQVNLMSSSIGNQIGAQISSMMQAAASAMTTSISNAMASAMSSIGNGFSFDADAFSNAVSMNMSATDLQELMMSLMSTDTSSYGGNLLKFGYADKDVPTNISIYPRDFEGKGEIISILDGYNERMKNTEQDDKVISYTDLVGTLMSSVTDIINAISYVLIAFVAISLVVSSIMIGVITYISVLERRKEIGILRAIGASKHNISTVFNAETFIIGILAGVIGIIITELLLIPGNALIHYLTDQPGINAYLPPAAAVILILLSVILTMLGGLIPSRKAAKSDPVTALRTE